ncbi:synapsin-1-like [Hirundo rustica]|uniref:synapsin-1-like n=1 Tax=Hirundo rustica TaxID=43150 RepID=UPI001A952BF3|nr:synapsin-1-like [Hirundo rustica]
MRPGKGRPQEAEDVQLPPPDHSTEPELAPTPPPDAEQPPAQGAEDEAVARELEQLYLSHLRRLRGDPGDNDPPPRNGDPPFPERAPNTSLANEMALRYEGGGTVQPPGAAGEGGAGGRGAGVPLPQRCPVPSWRERGVASPLTTGLSRRPHVRSSRCACARSPLAPPTRLPEPAKAAPSHWLPPFPARPA